jgi:hypothetical protein
VDDSLHTVRWHFFPPSHSPDPYTYFTVILGFDKESTQIILLSGVKPDENADKAA